MSTPDRYMPGLTGLRGVAVAIVVAYHLGFLPGGFVGVDLFFVLSGFLITSLLIQHPPSGLAGMGRWWGRRIRRLTPAVAVVVLAVLVAFVTTSGVAIDALATLTWWQNWNLIIEGTPYWAPAPSPLRHAWSLSIEEQFYLLWPPMLLGLAAMGRRTGRPERFVAAVAIAGAVASFAWAAWLATAGGADLSRVYFGTDSRAGALLLGCAAAALLDGRPRARAGAAGTSMAVLGLGALAVLSTTMHPDERWTYTGGLAIAALSGLAILLAAIRPGPLTSVMSWAPLQWLGVHSYAIYLWSWPIQVWFEARVPGLGPALTAVCTVALTLPLSVLSMRLVEEPLRRQVSWATRVPLRRAAWGIGSLVLVAGILVAANSTELTVDEQVATEFERMPDPTTTAPPPPAHDGATTTTCVPAPRPAAPEFSGDVSQYDPSTVDAGEDPVGDSCNEAVRLLVVGDSTGRGAANGMRRVAPDGFEIWDRTELGCGLQTGDSDCPHWRDLWSAAVEEVDPDVVLVHLGVSDDLEVGADPPFMSAAASEQRRRVMGEAIDLLGSRGASVAWILPAVPLDNGTFYCGGRRTNSGCDPAWIARWNEDLAAAAGPRGTRLVDVEAWVSARGNLPSDRPDGLHLSGPALDAQANWLAQQLH